MPRGTVIQFANGPYADQLALTHETHLQACKKWDLNFVSTRTQISNGHPYWEKPHLALAQAKLGTPFIVWLDADTYWDGKTDLLEVKSEFQPNAVFGASWHSGWRCRVNEPKPDGIHYDHYNAGVFYLDNSRGQAVEFLESWIKMSDDNHHWHDQHALNKLAIEFPELFTQISHRWNHVEHNPRYQAQNPVVRAWHGGGGPDRVLEAMQNFLRKQNALL